MKTVSVQQAETSLSELLSEVEAGEDVVIARSGTPVVRLVLVRPVDVPPSEGETTEQGPINRQPGALRHLPGWRDFDPLTSDLFKPMTDEELAEEGWPV